MPRGLRTRKRLFKIAHNSLVSLSCTLPQHGLLGKPYYCEYNDGRTVWTKKYRNYSNSTGKVNNRDLEGICYFFTDDLEREAGVKLWNVHSKRNQLDKKIEAMRKLGLAYSMEPPADIRGHTNPYNGLIVPQNAPYFRWLYKQYMWKSAPSREKPPEIGSYMLYMYEDSISNAISISESIIPAAFPWAIGW